MEVITRVEAIAQGLSRYYTGEPCKRGHLTERYVSYRTCIECSKLNYQNHRLKDRQAYNESSRQYVARRKAADPEGYAQQRRKLAKDWIANNHEQYFRQKALYRIKTKLIAIDHYSNGTMACAHCGYDADLDALCLDHINDDGAQHRKELGISCRGKSNGYRSYERFMALGWPPGIQVLCANCNMIKELRRKRDGTPSIIQVRLAAEKCKWGGKATADA